MIDTTAGTEWIINRLRADQSPDGSWNYPFEAGITTDAYTIVLLRTLEIDHEPLIRGLAAKMLSKQEPNGAWKLFYDEEEGNLSATVDAYYALLYSGYYRNDDARILKAKRFITANGGLEEAGIFTKIVLAITGQLPYPRSSPLPIEIMLLPPHFPINIYMFSVYGRVNLIPIMLLADKAYSVRTAKSPDLSDIRAMRKQEVFWFKTKRSQPSVSMLLSGIRGLPGLPEQLHRSAVERAVTYMLDHLEADGTFYSYFSSTFFMIFALLSLGYRKTDPIIVNAISGLLSMKTEIKGLPHMQYTTADVWNTSLIGYALQSAGVSAQDPMIRRANRYLLGRQQYKFGDWAIHNRHPLPGGWGFSDVNTFNPDIDDTCAALRSISTIAFSHSDAWNRGVGWLLSMQNDDGGWAAFEKNTNSELLELLPIEKSGFILTDPSCADITGRTLELLGNFTTLKADRESVRKAVSWLAKHQEPDGSWYGRWGICYVYGTWAAVTGLRAVGISNRDVAIARAVDWLKRIQNKDGGWGESCRSDQQGKYVPLGESTLTHTAWALDALISASDRTTPEIERGVSFLLESLRREDRTTAYPGGQGIPGAFYIHYHSYRYIFPLLALSHYRRLFNT
ncbi:squalene--hopene cyclase [Paenibacillus thermotolerans]|uniref:squalene--hopene cyclase n=1 Tax=Paenibacillus thermotolerans TaxID=3027807 RepID=UPI002367C19E|nr:MULTISPECIES: squalene--hopene cyclase [unclassified Paenibacillus]